MAVRVSKDGSMIMSGSKDKSIKVFDFFSKQEIFHQVDAHDSFFLHRIHEFKTNRSDTRDCLCKQ